MTDRAMALTLEADDMADRLGGPALIGGVLDWPVAADDEPLQLVASLTAATVNDVTGLALAPDSVVSVFSYYTPSAWVLDYITYHGDPSELAELRSGSTQVVVHERGTPVHRRRELPSVGIQVAGEAGPGQVMSKLGGTPHLLQNQPLEIEGKFVLQAYVGDLPAAYADAFGLADAVCYLYASESGGLFFVHVT